METSSEPRLFLILELLRNLNPNILSVYGQPCCPQDQGSVESMNKFVKRIIDSVLAERRLLGNNPNWTEVLGIVAAAINSQHGHCKEDVSSFEVVYGQVFDYELSCTKEEACQYWTVPQWLQVINNPEFEAYMRENYYLDDEEAIEDINNGSFSNGSLPPDEKDEVLDDFFFKHLNDDSSTQEQLFEEEVAEERKIPTASREELSSSPPMDLRKQPPESLCLWQVGWMYHDVCDFVLQEKNTKASSKPVVNLQSDSTKVSPKPSKKEDTKASSQTLFDPQSGSNASDEVEDKYWKNLIPQCNWRFVHCFLKLAPPNCCQHPSGCNNFTHNRCATLWLLKNGMTIDGWIVVQGTLPFLLPTCPFKRD
jgi:hypothetical protein